VIFHHQLDSVKELTKSIFKKITKREAFLQKAVGLKKKEKKN